MHEVRNVKFGVIDPMHGVLDAKFGVVQRHTWGPERQIWRCRRHAWGSERQTWRCTTPCMALFGKELLLSKTSLLQIIWASHQ